MKEPQYYDDTRDDEYITIDFSKLWKRLKAGWKKVLWWTVGGFVLGCLVALSSPHKYQCIAKIAPELSTTATNRLNSVASMIGLSSTVLGTTDAVYPMVYPDLVKSPEFVAELFSMPVTVMDGKDSVKTDLLDYLLNYQKKSAAAFVLGLPGKVFDLFSKNDEDEDANKTVDPFEFTKDQNIAYRALCKSIIAEIDKKTLVLTLKVTMTDRHICADLCRAVEENLKKFVTRYRTDKAVNDKDYYSNLYEQVRKDYYDAQTVYTRYVDTHQGVVLQSVNNERERLRNDVNLKYQLYTSTAQQLQTAEAKVQLETPVFAEIISPTVPNRSMDSRKKKALVFALLAMIVGLTIVLVKDKDEE